MDTSRGAWLVAIAAVKWFGSLGSGTASAPSLGRFEGQISKNVWTSSVYQFKSVTTQGIVINVYSPKRQYRISYQIPFEGENNFFIQPLGGVVDSPGAEPDAVG